MVSPAQIADAHQAAVINVNRVTTNRGMALWQRMDYNALDISWAGIAPRLIQQVNSAQLEIVARAQPYTSKLASKYDFLGGASQLVPETLVGIDGSGRSVESLLHGAVTTTKQAVGAGLSSVQSFEAGAAYLASMLKTVLADAGRSAEMVAATGKGFTHYVRVVNPGACSRCAMLAGKSSYATAFKRHPACRCTTAAVLDDIAKLPKGFHDSPHDYFESLSDSEQDRIFTKAGAQAVRDGADISKVVSARRGAKGIGYSSAIGGGRQLGDPRGRFVKTTIGFRPDGTPVKVYTTTESTTVRGAFGRQQAANSATRKLQGARFTSTSRVRLMPESIAEIAGEDLPLRQAFLRDAGFLDYRPSRPFQVWADRMQDIDAQRRADRILVDRATLQFSNFTLG